MSDHLPFAPLTHHELNDRHSRAIGSVGYYLGACIRDERVKLSLGDESALIEAYREADAYLTAARLRCKPVSS